MAMQRLARSMTSDIGVRVLGPVEARSASGWVTAPPQQRLFLAVLALRVGQVVPVGELVDAIWPDAPPASARASVQVMVTRLRRILSGLPGGDVQRCGDGYRLAIASSVDVQQFRLLARAARDAPDAVAAVAAFDQALALWRGPALADVPANARTEAIRFALAEERLSATQDRISALLSIGGERQAAEELTGLIAAHPTAERLAGLRMVALYRCGRQADALQVFRDLRGRLSGELGIEPGRELQVLHQQMLAGDLDPPGTGDRLTRPAVQLPGEQREVAAAEGATPSAPRQLPTGGAHFTGRAAELRVLDSLLDRVGSVDGTVAIGAITGTAGVGKTTLALHWAHQKGHAFPDGQLYVNLRAFDPSGGPIRAADAIHGFLDALGVPQNRRPTGTEALAALYRTMLASRRMLVILDNAADGDQVRPLLPGADGCLVLITSRRQLAGLAAREGATLLTLDVLSPPEAIALLAARLGSAITAGAPEAASRLATLCSRLPLALTIAAVRVAERHNRDLTAMTAQMEDIGGRLDVLDTGERASSLRAVLSWSYENLSQPAARMFRLLGVHPGPDIGLAAAARLAGCEVVSARRILAELVGAHVVSEHAPGRWTFHDLLRAYAREQARREEDPAEHDAATVRVLDYYVQAAWSAAMTLRAIRAPVLARLGPSGGAESNHVDSPDEAMTWYDAEQQVLAEVISWAVAAGLDDHAWRLSQALTDYVGTAGRWRAQTVTMRIAHEPALREGEAGQRDTGAPQRRLRVVPVHTACDL
jgi:DNA-binding SARP family transcriptional activator